MIQGGMCISIPLPRALGISLLYQCLPSSLMDFCMNFVLVWVLFNIRSVNTTQNLLRCITSKMYNIGSKICSLKHSDAAILLSTWISMQLYKVLSHWNQPWTFLNSDPLSLYPEFRCLLTRRCYNHLRTMKEKVVRCHTKKR